MLRQGGIRGALVQPFKLFDLLREAAPALAGQGAQDALECLEACTPLRGIRDSTWTLSKRCIARPDPLGVVDATAPGLSVRR